MLGRQTPNHVRIILRNTGHILSLLEGWYALLQACVTVSAVRVLLHHAASLTDQS